MITTGRGSELLALRESRLQELIAGVFSLGSAADLESKEKAWVVRLGDITSTLISATRWSSGLSAGPLRGGHNETISLLPTHILCLSSVTWGTCAPFHLPENQEPPTPRGLMLSISHFILGEDSLPSTGGRGKTRLLWWCRATAHFLTGDTGWFPDLSLSKLCK